MEEQVGIGPLVNGLVSGVIMSFVLFSLLAGFTRLRSREACLISAAVVIVAYLPIAIYDGARFGLMAVHIAFYSLVPWGLYALSTIWGRCRKRYTVNLGSKGAPLMIAIFLSTVALLDFILIGFAGNGVKLNDTAWLIPAGTNSIEGGTDFSSIGHAPLNQMRGQTGSPVSHKGKNRYPFPWHLRKGFVETPHAGRASVFQVEVMNQEGVPLSGAKISARFRRPSRVNDDQRFQMREHEPGLYQARVSLPQAGKWKILLYIRHGTDRYEAHGLTVIDPPKPGSRID